MFAGMTANQIESAKLQFARQLYDRCLERHGPDHEQTRLMRNYIAALESQDLAKVFKFEHTLRRDSFMLPNGTSG